MEFSLRVGSDFHTQFSRTTPHTCQFHPIESTARLWFDSSTDPRILLTIWATTYATEFARHHPTPPAWKAARVLRQRVARPADISGIAAAVGASRSSLVISFKRTFAMTPSEYHARVRLAYGLSELRRGGTKVEDAARQAGFASVKNFNRAVRTYIAMKPSEARELPCQAFERLLRNENELLTDPSALATIAHIASLQLSQRHIRVHAGRAARGEIAGEKTRDRERQHE